MNQDGTRTWPVMVAENTDWFLSFWHTCRAPIIASILVLILCLFLVKSRKAQTYRLRNVSPISDEKPKGPENENTLKKDFSIAQTREKAAPKAASFALSQNKSNGKPTAAKVVTGQKPAKQRRAFNYNQPEIQRRLGSIQPLIYFTSLTGTTERLSKELFNQLTECATKHPSILPPQVFDLTEIDLDDHFISGPKVAASSYPPSPSHRTHASFFYLIIIPSYDIDTFINTFLSHLDETHNDFRIDTAPLSSLAGYSVFGIGDKEGWPSEREGFCSQAIEVDRWMAKLTGRKRAYPLGTGDIKCDVNGTLRRWCDGIWEVLRDISMTGSLGEGVPGSGDALESGEEASEDESTDFPDSSRKKRQKTASSVLADLEDVGDKVVRTAKASQAIDFTTSSTTSSTSLVKSDLKEMVPKSSPTHAALTKQGYTIIGSHSGVKLCRWTKSALRGRGSCYKFSFYGIKSHLCMETTPSLSCSNKCVFCWRHGTNPVSTTWRWQVDPPEDIFKGALEGHYQKIKMMRGVPGVREERFREGMRVRHCALSLVGEPIFYPHINEFIGMLHDERISSFLVCNAQHPDQLQSLGKVTQLYVSIDASNRVSLKKIDRPLHRDFWERFQRCLDIIREKKNVQRTVFRLTLVKGFNIDEEVEGYADLVEQGLPCFVEVKGVTYCGTSSSAGAGLTMQNVPFYEEVVAFVETLDKALARRGLGYGIAAEHAHSCCILLASKRFLIDGRWNTVINYERFFELLEGGKEFSPEAYCSQTPEWALWGNGGFNPEDERVDRKGRPKVLANKDQQAKKAEGARPPREVVVAQAASIDF